MIKYKIRRSRESFRALQSLKKQNEIEDQGGLGCIGVDGKRDRKSKKVMTYALDGVAFEKKVVGTEEHLSYTAEPEGEYLAHTVIPQGKGTGYDLSQDFLDIIREYNSKDSLVAILCDGTSVNTGWKDGFLSHVERELQDVILRLICMLHGNELPFRHLLSHYDG